MQAGKFITLEGIEGVGKSSNMQFIAEYLKASQKEVVLTREPGGTPIAEALRKILLAEYEETTCPETELLILYAGRFQHVENLIKPALAKGQWVISDRFNDATFAYQGAGRKITYDKIALLDQWTLGDFRPDLTIILDAPVEIAMQRIIANRQLDRFEKEKEDFFKRIREAYLERAKRDPNRYWVVDASRALSDVQADIKQRLTHCLKEA